jgi:hypothetical protein
MVIFVKNTAVRELKAFYGNWLGGKQRHATHDTGQAKIFLLAFIGMMSVFPAESRQG